MTTIASEANWRLLMLFLMQGVTDRGQGEKEGEAESESRDLMASLLLIKIFPLSTLSAIWVIDSARKGVFHLSGLFRFTGTLFHSGDAVSMDMSS